MVKKNTKIIEALHKAKWWIQLLWTEPLDFPYYAASELFRALGQKWGFIISFENGKVKRKLLIGLK